MPAPAVSGAALPRWLRRSVRVFWRLLDGDIRVPNHAAGVLSLMLVGGFAGYGAYEGGHAPEIVKFVTSRSGFAVDQIKVTGHRETSEIDVLQALELDGWTSLVGFDVAAARERVEALPWVETASLRKTYPNSLEVQIEERKPFAIWQKDGELTVIEANGDPIVPYTGGRQALLPLVVGSGAAKDAAAFVAEVASIDGLAGRARGFIRVGERRWDVLLDNGVTIRLPEGDDVEALAEVVDLDRQSGLLSRDISVVDVRLADRIVVKLTETGVKSWDNVLKEREKARKRAGKRA